MTVPDAASRRRFGFVGIIINRDSARTAEVHRILSDHAELIQGRMGLPHLDDDRISVITLIVHASSDELGSLSGRLGRLAGVVVKRDSPRR